MSAPIPAVDDVLTSLVQIPSENPGSLESALATRIEEWLRPLPMTVERVHYAPGRPSIGAILEGDAEGPRFLLNGHMDTVPAGDRSQWTHDPFGGTQDDGFLYGRGACDMKAGLAVQIVTAYRIAASTSRRHGSLVLHFAAGEERAEPGTKSLLKAGFAADYGIVTEPTDLRVAIASPGLCHPTITIQGTSGHASVPETVNNPIGHLNKVLTAIGHYDAELQERPHPTLLPAARCTPTIIRAGGVPNQVPDHCDLTLDRRLLPNESAEDVRHELETILKHLRRDDPQLQWRLTLGDVFYAAAANDGSDFAREVATVAHEFTGRDAALVSTTYASDFRELVNVGAVNAVTFGAGSVEETHCANERITLKDVESALEVVVAVARRYILSQ